MSTNKYGLARSIPAAVKLAIRQICGFGCVICGAGIYDYEHADPEFNEAQSHNPANMTLLCMTCHGNVTRKFWSKEKVKSAMKSPFCKRQGYSNQFFDFGSNHPSLTLGGVRIENCEVPVEIGGQPLFEIKPPEQSGAPFRFSGTFYDSNGKASLRIADNEWQALNNNWDVEVIGPSIRIREKTTKGAFSPLSGSA